jgi:WD40 repeat protein/class 3 adenylate cyclase
MKVINAHSSPIISLSLSPNQQSLVSVGTARQIKVWDVNTGNLKHTIKANNTVIKAGITSANQLVYFVQKMQLVESAPKKKQNIPVTIMHLQGLTAGSRGKSLRIHEDSDGKTTVISLSQDGKLAMSAAYIKTNRVNRRGQREMMPELKLWNLQTGTLIRKLQKPIGRVYALACNQAGTLLAACSNDVSGRKRIIEVWDVASGSIKYRLAGSKSIATALSFDHQNQQLVSGHANRILMNWNLSARNKRWSNGNGHQSSVQAIRLSPDGKYIVSGSRDNTVVIWDAQSLKFVKSLIKHTGSVNSITFLGNDSRRFLSAAGDAKIVLWDINTQSSINSFWGHRGTISSVVFSAQRNMFFSGSLDNSLRAWKPTQNKFVQKKPEAHVFGLRQLAISPNHTHILTAGGDNKIKLWTTTLALRQTFIGHSSDVLSIDFSPDGRYFVSGGRDEKIVLWETNTGKKIRTITRAHRGGVNAVRFSPNGQLIASGGNDQTAKLWQVADGKLLKVFDGYPSNVMTVEFSANSEFVFSGSRDNTLNIWDTNAEPSNHTLNLFSTERVLAQAAPPEAPTFGSAKDIGVTQTVALAQNTTTTQDSNKAARTLATNHQQTIFDNYKDAIKGTERRLNVLNQDMIANGKSVSENLEQVKVLLSNHPQKLSNTQKDSLLGYIQALEKQLDENLDTYQKLYQQHQQKISDVRKIADLEKSFAEKYQRTIFGFTGIILALIVGTLITVSLASRFRKQRNSLNVLTQNLAKEKETSESLLLNILPAEVADELKSNQQYVARTYEQSSVLFSDFVGFTRLAQKMDTGVLIQELDDCFTGFDEIIARHHLEKIKTIGDAYMCVGGIPSANKTNPVDAVLAALEMKMFIEKKRKARILDDEDYWECRFGVSTGEVIAGVIGKSKFAYDVWGDTVNTASRMESNSVSGKVNISLETYELVKDFFECEFRGEIEVKGKGQISMYFVNAIKPSLSVDGKGFRPNEVFEQKRDELYKV